MFAGVYGNRRVLVTGHTGFKGSWLCAWLLELGARVAGFSLNIPTVPSNFEASGLKNRITDFKGDIRDLAALARVFETFDPEIVFHLAAQSLVRRSYSEPVLTFETNSLGTLNVLECLRQRPRIRAGVIITSDKCYLNREWTWGYRENDVLGGYDPYSASKACAELVFQSYVQSYYQSPEGPLVSTTRAGNVIGGGDWAPDRIVPDCIRAWAQGESVRIRHPQASRPWQHVLEPLSGYLWLGANLWQRITSGGESFNFGPAATINQSVGELVSSMAQRWPGARWETEIEGGSKQPESTLLKLCCDKALNFLGWRAILSFPETIALVIDWYRAYYGQGEGRISELTIRQIREYSQKAADNGLVWAS